jgi:hypothetical protein
MQTKNIVRIKKSENVFYLYHDRVGEVVGKSKHEGKVYLKVKLNYGEVLEILPEDLEKEPLCTEQS